MMAWWISLMQTKHGLVQTRKEIVADAAEVFRKRRRLWIGSLLAVWQGGQLLNRENRLLRVFISRGSYRLRSRSGTRHRPSPTLKLPVARGGKPTLRNIECCLRDICRSDHAAKKVERQVERCAAAMLLESRIGERFDAIVTGASDKDTWVRILHPPVEGRLVSGFEGMDVGHRLRVQLIHTDVDRGYIDFERQGAQ